MAPDSTIIRELLNPDTINTGVSARHGLADGTITSGKKTLQHRLKSSSEVYNTLEGRTRISVNEKVVEIGQGSLVYVAPHAMQYVENIGDFNLQYLVICDSL